MPEGFYYIDRFNPQSHFYLSLGINYPNAADRIRIGQVRPGGDIFIHGACVTVGCLPLTDDKIKELYLMAVEAKSRGQSRIPVHIFPSRLSVHGWEKLKQTYHHDASLLQFWENLKTGYDWFEVHKQLPVIQVSSQGHYQFAKG